MARLTRAAAAFGALAALALGLTACASDAGGTDSDTTADTEVQTLLVATGASPKPYTYLDENDELTGYDIEILRLIDERLDDVAFEFEVADFTALFAGLDSGRFNIVANNLSATDERREKYDFSDPYIEAQFGIVTQTDHEFGEITSLDDLAGTKTYGEAGLNFTKVLEAYNEANPDAQIQIEYTEADLQTQYNGLATGAVDFIFNERVVYQGYGADAGLNLEFHQLDGTYLSDTFGTNLFSAFAFSRATDQSAVLEKINGALNELLADGSISALSEEFFDGLDVTPGANTDS